MSSSCMFAAAAAGRSWDTTSRGCGRGSGSDSHGGICGDKSQDRRCRGCECINQQRSDEYVHEWQHVFWLGVVLRACYAMVYMMLIRFLCLLAELGDV